MCGGLSDEVEGNGRETNGSEETGRGQAERVRLIIFGHFLFVQIFRSKYLVFSLQNLHFVL